MDRPGLGRGRSGHGVAPLTNSGFFSNVDLLARANQANNDTPLRDALRELDEMLRLGLVIARATLGRGNLCWVKRPLSFVENQNVFGRYQARSRQVPLDIGLNGTNERGPAAAATFEFVLEDLHQGAVTGQVDSRSRGLARSSIYSEVIQEPCVRELQPDQSLAGPGKSAKKDKVSGVRALAASWATAVMYSSVGRVSESARLMRRSSPVSMSSRAASTIVGRGRYASGSRKARCDTWAAEVAT